MSILTVSSPGKLILSGEHAVVHGAPAIGFPLPLTLTMSFETRPVDHKTPLTTEQSYLIDLFEKHYAIQLPPFSCSIHSNIPIGCGLGSSAAFVVSTLKGLYALADLTPERDEGLSLARSCENLFHGASSGLDTTISWLGKCIYFEQHRIQHTATGRKLGANLILTGTPLSSTASCVQAVKKHFQDKGLLSTFARVTQSMWSALLNQEMDKLCTHIRENHQLLCKLGVVPQKVRNFIQTLEQQGLSAKICGAGSIHGEAAGAILALGDRTTVKAISQDFGYSVLEEVL